MKIVRLRVQGFRSIHDESLECGPLTALVGPNGCGKSSFLRALDLFYSQVPRVSIDDIFGKDPERPIEISVTYGALSPPAQKLFASYLQDDLLTVDRIFSIADGRTSSKLHGSRLLNPAFSTVRAAGSAQEKKLAYQALSERAEFAGLPPWKNQAAGLAALDAWERENPEKLSRERDDGQFFGFSEVAQGYLGRFTRFLFVPAVRDAASDSEERKGSVLTDLMDLLVRSVIANRDELRLLQADTQKRYQELLDPARLSELTSLADALTSTLNAFVPGAGLELTWQPLETVAIPMPKARTLLVEDDFRAAVDRTGHGLQRALILTLLQHLAVAQVRAAGTTQMPSGSDTQGLPKDPGPSLVFAIEEPELYQHPNRQRHLARVLLQLATGRTPGVVQSTQMLYATHSPFFVGLDRINDVRLLRKSLIDGRLPKATRVVHADLDAVAERLWCADGSTGTKFTAETLLPRLATLMTPWMSEGFFADKVVLVEGEDDRAAIGAAALIAGVDLEAQGIAVIPCGGKTNLDRPFAIFSSLGIPVFVIWDGDYGSKDARPEDNRRLLRLCGVGESDWPSGVWGNCACFAVDLETTLRDDLGTDRFEGWLSAAQSRFGIPKKKHATKNPDVLRYVLGVAIAEGYRLGTLEAIVTAFLRLAAPPNGRVDRREERLAVSQE